jgi:hypothetical protein
LLLALLQPWFVSPLQERSTSNESTGEADPTVLHILAAAFAQRGQFPEAIETAERGLQLATAQNKESLAKALRTEIGFYQVGLPYRIGR